MRFVPENEEEDGKFEIGEKGILKEKENIREGECVRTPLDEKGERMINCASDRCKRTRTRKYNMENTKRNV